MFISSYIRSCFTKKLYFEIKLTYSEDVIFLKSHAEFKNSSKKSLESGTIPKALTSVITSYFVLITQASEREVRRRTSLSETLPNALNYQET